MFQNILYPQLPYKIWDPTQSYEDCIGMPTGSDSTRALLRRMAQLRYDHIIRIFNSY